MAEQKYVIGRLEAEIKNGQIFGEIKDLVLHEGARPKTAQEFGADPEQIARLNTRQKGPIKTLVRLGVGCALVVKNAKNLTYLPDEGQMSKVMDKIGDLKNVALLGPRRNIMAGGTWLCQDTCSGVLEEKDFVAGAIRELAEVGLYINGGWGRYKIEDSMQQIEYSIYQTDIEKEQKETWQIANSSDWLMELAVAPVKGLKYDNIDGINCLVSGEPNVGSLEFILVFETSLELSGWKIMDLETGYNATTKETFLLNRQPLGIFPRKAGRPVQLGFGPNGLDLDYPIVVLDPDNLRMNTNTKVQIVLDRLGWL